MTNRSKSMLLFLVALTSLLVILAPASETASAANQFQARTISITKSAKQITDSLNGVKTYYRKGGNDGSNQFYSCAAYVKRYYKTVYGKNVYNLLYRRTPQTSGDSFVSVSNPRIGDIVGMNTDHATTHWAIVKRVNHDGTVTLIEQNWKWSQGGSTKSVVNRKVKISNVRFYRLKSENAVNTVSLSVGNKKSAEPDDEIEEVFNEPEEIDETDLPAEETDTTTEITE